MPRAISKRLLLRFEFKQQRHYGMKLMAYTLIAPVRGAVVGILTYPNRALRCMLLPTTDLDSIRTTYQPDALLAP
jgi:hypothetical protein